MLYAFFASIYRFQLFSLQSDEYAPSVFSRSQQFSLLALLESNEYVPFVPIQV